MDLTIEIASNDKIITEETIQDLHYYNSQSFLTQTKTGDQLVVMSPDIKKVYYVGIKEYEIEC